MDVNNTVGLQHNGRKNYGRASHVRTRSAQQARIYFSRWSENANAFNRNHVGWL